MGPYNQVVIDEYFPTFWFERGSFLGYFLKMLHANIFYDKENVRSHEVPLVLLNNFPVKLKKVQHNFL